MIYSLIAFISLFSVFKSMRQDIPVDHSDLVNALEVDTVAKVNWDRVVREMQSGIDDGLEEATKYTASNESSVHFEEESPVIGRRLMTKFRSLIAKEGSIDVYRAVYVMAAVASGLSLHLRNGIAGRYGENFILSPSSAGTGSIAVLFSASYLLAVQGLVLALVAPLDKNVTLMQLREAPKASFLVGIFASMAVISNISSAAVLGQGVSTMISTVVQVVLGLCLDTNGFFGHLAKRRVTKTQIMGALTMVGGVIATLDLNDLVQDADRSLSHIMPFMGLAMIAGATNTVAATFNSTLSSFAGSPLVAGAILSLLGTFSVMMVAMVMYIIEGQPSVNMVGSQWWEWMGGIVGIYTVLSIPVLTQKLGLGTFICVRGASFSMSSVLTDAGGLFGPEIPLSPLRMLGLGMSILGLVITQVAPGVVIAPASLRPAPRLSPSDSNAVASADIKEYIEDIEFATGIFSPRSSMHLKNLGDDAREDGNDVQPSVIGHSSFNSSEADVEEARATTDDDAAKSTISI